jgi:hypothetical protein
LKKIILLFILTVGLTSCSDDSNGDNDNETEITYADVKPTQTKYKAYYGQKLTKNSTSVTSRSFETSPDAEMNKPVSAIFYPRTQTISFSNIFDNKTVEYKVTSITINEGVSVVYSFEINGSTFKCTIEEKTNLNIANVIINFAGGYYKFEITDSAKKNIAKLVSKVTYTAKYQPTISYTIKYTYADTLLMQSVRNSYDAQALKDVIRINDYSYDGAKLIKKVSKKDGIIVSTITYEYENNLITKETIVTQDNIKRINTFEYDNLGRIITVNYFNSTGANFNSRNYTFEKNKLTTIYTDSQDSYRDVEVSTYESDRMPFLISQDEILDPFLYLGITKSISTSREGEVQYFGDFSYEYSADGLLIKRTEILDGDQVTTLVREYVEE